MQTTYPVHLKYRDGIFCHMEFTRAEAVAVGAMLTRAAESTGESRQFEHCDYPDWTVAVALTDEEESH